MTIHFENLWEEAERLSLQTNPPSRLDSIFQELTQITQELVSPACLESQRPFILGQLLYILAKFSQHQQINVYAALAETVAGVKIDLFEPERKF